MSKTTEGGTHILDLDPAEGRGENGTAVLAQPEAAPVAPKQLRLSENFVVVRMAATQLAVDGNLSLEVTDDSRLASRIISVDVQVDGMWFMCEDGSEYFCPTRYCPTFDGPGEGAKPFYLYRVLEKPDVAEAADEGAQSTVSLDTLPRAAQEEQSTTVMDATALTALYGSLAADRAEPTTLYKKPADITEPTVAEAEPSATVLLDVGETPPRSGINHVMHIKVTPDATRELVGVRNAESAAPKTHTVSQARGLSRKKLVIFLAGALGLAGATALITAKMAQSGDTNPAPASATPMPASAPLPQK